MKQHRDNFLPRYPKEYALREITLIFSFTGIHIVETTKDKRKVKTPRNSINLQLYPYIIHKTYHKLLFLLSEIKERSQQHL